MNFNELAAFINQTGFPIFVAVVLLWRVDAMHTANLNAINALTTEIRLLRAELANLGHLPAAAGR